MYIYMYIYMCIYIYIYIYIYIHIYSISFLTSMTDYFFNPKILIHTHNTFLYLALGHILTMYNLSLILHNVNYSTI